MAKFRKKPVVIEAIQLTPELCLHIWKAGMNVKSSELIFGRFSPSGSWNIKTGTFSDGWVTIDTLEGSMRADIGDWIIKGVMGEFYPCKPAIFEATYEAVEE